MFVISFNFDFLICLFRLKSKWRLWVFGDKAEPNESWEVFVFSAPIRFI